MTILDYNDEQILEVPKELYDSSNPFYKVVFKQRLFSYCVRNHIDMKPYVEKYDLKFVIPLETIDK